jgi:hypothetical protein
VFPHRGQRKPTPVREQQDQFSCGLYDKGNYRGTLLYFDIIRACEPLRLRKSTRMAVLGAYQPHGAFNTVLALAIALGVPLIVAAVLPRAPPPKRLGDRVCGGKLVLARNHDLAGDVGPSDAGCNEDMLICDGMKPNHPLGVPPTGRTVAGSSNSEA